MPYSGEEVALKMLLEHGVNKNAQNKKGLVPLHVTVGKANVPSTKLLVKYKASVNIKVSWKFVLHVELVIYYNH